MWWGVGISRACLAGLSLWCFVVADAAVVTTLAILFWRVEYGRQRDRVVRGADL